MKKISMLLVLVILFFSIIACQSGGTTAPTKDTMEPKKDTMEPKKDTTVPKKDTTEPKKDTTTAVSGVKWGIYACDALPEDPANGDATFTKSNAAGTTRNEIMDDPAIKGNKLFLHVTEMGNRLQYKMELGNPGNMLTVILRAKAFDNSSKDYSFEVDAHVQPSGWREKVQGTKMDTVMLPYVKVQSEKKVNTAEWHIYRMTFSPTGVAVYVDESETPIVTAPKSTTSTSSDYFRFGSADRGVTFGCYYDWVIWTTEGAFSPKAAPLPAGLTGVK